MIHLASAFNLCPCGRVHRELAGPNPAAWRRQYRGLFLSNTMKGAMLDAVDESAAGIGMKYGSLHTAFSTTGTNELTGGSYARIALTWAAASAGAKALAATLPTWQVPAGNTVAWWGIWDAITTGNFLGMLPLGAGTLRPASTETSTDITNDDIFAVSHGYTAGTRVVFWPASGSALPTGLTEGTIYFVIATGLATNSFRVSTTSGGSAVDLTGTSPFNFFAQSCVPEVFAGAGQYAMSSGSVDLAAVA